MSGRIHMVVFTSVPRRLEALSRSDRLFPSQLLRIAETLPSTQCFLLETGGGADFFALSALMNCLWSIPRSKPMSRLLHSIASSPIHVLLSFRSLPQHRHYTRNTETVAMKQSASVQTPSCHGSSASPVPSTPYDLSGVHPGDARHAILEIRMSGSRSSGNKASYFILYYSGFAISLQVFRCSDSWSVKC